MRPRVSSTDMKSRLPYTDTSPWPPGQTIDAMSFGDGESLMSYALKPLKLPAMARSWLKARSEFANLRKPADEAGAAACPDAGVEAPGCPDAGVEPPGCPDAGVEAAGGVSGGVVSPAGALGSKKPSGFGRLATSSMFRMATPASRRPAFSPTRGSEPARSCARP